MLDEAALSTHLFVHDPLTADRLQSVRRNGFTRVELWVAQPHVNYRSSAEWSEVLTALNEADLAVCSVHAPFYRTVADAAHGKFLSISAAEEAERRAAINETYLLLKQMPLPTTDLLVVHPGAPGDFASAGCMDRLCASIEELLALAAERGVRIALENMPFPGAGCGEMLALLDRFQSPRLGLGFDLGHANLLDSSPELLVECLARSWVIHVHDNDGKRDSHLLPFEGTIDWRAFAACLERSRPQAPLVLELRCKEDPEPCIQEARRRVTRILAQVK